MSKYLITPTLINAYQYYINDEFKSPTDSRAEFLKTLSKEKFKPSEAMQKGIDFEDKVQFLTTDITVDDLRHFYKEKVGETVINHKLTIEDAINWLKQQPEFLISQVVENGLWQQTCKKDLKVGNKEFLLYGKMDVIKRDTIYDIKFTDNYELGKFLDSSQHLIYLYCTGLPKFQYLISDGEDYWIEDYHNHTNIENEIKSKISDFLSYLENDKEAKEMFETKWGVKYE
jgi:hypothetical protein